MLKNSHDFVKLLTRELVKNPQRIIDMTLGNGHDSYWLKEAYPQAELIGFDIQKKAIANSKKRLEAFEKVELYLESHDKILDFVKEEVDFAIYNLGFLPGGDKEITTEKETVISSLKDLLSLLKRGGLVLMTCYPGHLEGRKEGEAVEEFLLELNQREYTVSKFQFINQINNPPCVFSVQKRNKDE